MVEVPDVVLVELVGPEWRLPGWVAQRREMINDPGARIGRSRQVRTGQGER